MAFPSNPFDRHTLVEALAKVCRLTGKQIDEAFVVRSYCGHGETQTRVYLSRQKRGVISARLRKSIKRRQAIEPVIGYMNWTVYWNAIVSRAPPVMP